MLGILLLSIAEIQIHQMSKVNENNVARVSGGPHKMADAPNDNYVVAAYSLFDDHKTSLYFLCGRVVVA